MFVSLTFQINRTFDHKRPSPHLQADRYNFADLTLREHPFCNSPSSMAAVPYHFKALVAAGIKPPKDSYVPILVDGPLILLTVRYQNVVRDLWTIWFLYAFQYPQVNRTMVINRVATILQDCAELRPLEQDFTDLYDVFFHNVYVCASKILSVLDAAENRERFRERVRHAVHVRKSVQTRAAFRPDIKPWNQFANAGAPVLPAVASFCPHLWPMHVNLPPEYTYLRATSVQTLPPATSAILSKWTADWQRVMEYLHEVGRSSYTPGNQEAKCGTGAPPRSRVYRSKACKAVIKNSPDCYI